MPELFPHLLPVISFCLYLIVFCHQLTSLSLHSSVSFSFRLFDPLPLFSLDSVPLLLTPSLIDISLSQHLFLSLSGSHYHQSLSLPPPHPTTPHTHIHSFLIHILLVSVSLELPEGIKSTFKFIFLFFLFPVRLKVLFFSLFFSSL